VILREDAPGEKRLTAYVVEEPRATSQEPESSALGAQFVALGSQLREFLAQRLPDYMLPSAFVLLDALPLTSSGKIDRRALPKPVQDHAVEMQRYVAPRTPIEEMLVGIWVQVLGLSHRPDRPALGIHDHFFALGGHSLLVIQAMFRIREVFQVDLPLHSLFNAPTVAEFAQLIDKDQRDELTPHSPAIVRLDRNRHRARALPSSSETASI
jgi:acyl carrier protein